MSPHTVPCRVPKPDSRSRAATRAAVLVGSCWTAGLASPALVAAQWQPLGPEVQVNSYTTGGQYWPRIAPSSDGGFAVFWCCQWFEDLGTVAIAGQRFAADGTRLGSEFAVSQHSPRVPSDVAAMEDDGFVVVWGQGQEGCPPCSSDYIKGRRLAGDGAPLGEQFAVSQPPGSEQTGYAAVSGLESGGFVVAWESSSVFARRFDPGGLPLGMPFEVDGAEYRADGASLSPQPGGGFLVVWDQVVDVGSEVRGRRYDAQGEPTGALLILGGSDRAFVGDPDVAARSTTGDFVVVWPRGSASGYAVDLHTRRFEANGMPLTPSIQVNTFTPGLLSRPAAAHEVDGGFDLVWESLGSQGSDSDSWSIQARRFSPEGLGLGLEFQLNSYTTGAQYWPHLVVAPNGDLLAAWTSYGSFGTDQDSSSVQLRRFRPPYFIDGFEPGNTSRWSSTTP